jgi:MOSC domain-containing protein
VGDHGLLGDRVYALLDRADGKVATAKNPRKWPSLFAFRATFIEPSGSSVTVPPVRMTLPDGTIVTSAQPDCHQVLSKALNREVTLTATERGQVADVQSSGPASWTAKAEEYWPDMEGLDYRDTVTDFALPTGTFFDCATVHLLTTATLNRLQDFYPQGRFEVQRFRPNIVVEPVGSERSFAEQAWIGHTLAIGDEVRLHITGPCGRCVMTTLAQGELPQDSGILRAAVQHHQGQVGVYAAVVRGGTIRPGDRVRLDT